MRRSVDFSDAGVENVGQLRLDQLVEVFDLFEDILRKLGLLKLFAYRGWTVVTATHEKLDAFDSESTHL